VNLGIPIMEFPTVKKRTKEKKKGKKRKKKARPSGHSYSALS